MLEWWNEIKKWREQFATQYSLLAFCAILGLGFVVGTVTWYGFIFGLVEKYKTDRMSKLEDENEELRGLLQGHARFESQGIVTNLMVATLNDELLVALKGTNALVSSELVNAKIEAEELRGKIKRLEAEYADMKLLRDKIPDGCTNMNQLVVVCDFAKKMNLRTAAIDRSMAELDDIKTQMFHVALKPLSVMGSVLKATQTAQQGADGINFMTQFCIALLNIDRLYVHFAKHITTSADNIFLLHMHDSAEQLQVRLCVPFRCLENSRGMLKQMLELEVLDKEFYTKMSNIVEVHLKNCGMKQGAK